VTGHAEKSTTDLVFSVLPIESHPVCAAGDEWFLGHTEEAIKSDSKGSDLLLVRVTLRWKARSVKIRVV
jgi:hypothetical protein